jgi:NADH:ubiquinone reductase (non-electrogenic)
MKKIIIIGSGWASSTFIKEIDTNKYDIEVISPNKFFVYTPLLGSSTTKELNLTQDIQNLNKINYIKDELTEVKFQDNKIITKKNNIYNYDFLILAHGSSINTFNIDGVDDNCFKIKNDYDTKLIRDKISNLKPGSKIAVIGCGLTGTEIIGNLIDYNKFNIYAIDGLSRPLNIFNESISNYTLDFWKKNNVNINLNNFVSKIDNKNIYFKNDKLNYDLAIWCGGVKISPLSIYINKTLGLENRFGIPVNKYLQVEKTKNIYAIGDCAYSGNPPTAQVASQQGKYLANYFNNDFKDIKPFNFQSKGQICYIGGGNSVYQNNNIIFKGKLTGYLNNFIHIYNSINLNQAFDFIFKN